MTNTYNTQRLIHEFQKQGGYAPGIDAEQLDREFDLVAAAPDLLAALKILLSAAAVDGIPSGWGIVIDNARAAIAKAKGE